MLALFIGIPVLVAMLTGSLSIPHSDAWSHSKIAQTFARSGHIRLLGWNRTSLVGQVVVLGPLGRSIAAQQLFVAATAIAALVGCYQFLRLSGVESRSALFATAATGAVADFGLLSTSYMSDMSAFAALMVSVWLTAYALKTNRIVPMLGAITIGLWGVTVREQAVVAPIVALAAALVTWRGRRRWLAIALSVLSFGLLVAFETWRRRLGLGDSPIFTFAPKSAIRSSLSVAYTLALFLVPLAALCSRPSRWRRRSQVIASAVTAIAILYAAQQKGSVFLGTALNRTGASSLASIGGQNVLPSSMWLPLIALSCLGMGALVGLLVESSFAYHPLSLAVSVLLILGTFGELLVGQAVFSRYLLPMLPFLSASLLLGTDVRRTMPSRVVLVVAGIVGFMITSNGLAFDAARWHAANVLVKQGVAATDIDAGFEWVGYHSPTPADQSRLSAPTLGTVGWWERMFAGSKECYVVSASPLPHLKLVRMIPYRKFALLGSAQLDLYANPKCP